MVVSPLHSNVSSTASLPWNPMHLASSLAMWLILYFLANFLLFLLGYSISCIFTWNTLPECTSKASKMLCGFLAYCVAHMQSYQLHHYCHHSLVKVFLAWPEITCTHVISGLVLGTGIPCSRADVLSLSPFLSLEYSKHVRLWFANSELSVQSLTEYCTLSVLFSKIWVPTQLHTHIFWFQ